MANSTNYYYYAAAAATTIAGILHLVLAANLIVRGPLFGIFFLIAGIAQLFWALPMAKRWGKMWYYVGIAGTIVLIIIFFVTRVPNPITGGRALPTNSMGVVIEVFQFIFIGLTVFILTRQRRLTDNQKEQLK
jgi:uncharacterized membrane protein HdeD (DUF308 family)